MFLRMDHEEQDVKVLWVLLKVGRLLALPVISKHGSGKG